jgi:hydroxymethylbilane synthase
LDAAWGDPQDLSEDANVRPASPLVRASEQAEIGTLAQAQALGERVASRLRAAGAQGA